MYRSIHPVQTNFTRIIICRFVPRIVEKYQSERVKNVKGISQQQVSLLICLHISIFAGNKENQSAQNNF